MSTILNNDVSREVAKIVLKAKYPNLTMVDEKNDGLVTAAKNIRAELKAAYPGVKFSVKTSRFSMGDSITINWTDGPNSAQVEAVTNKYKAGNFDGYDDCYRYERTDWNDAFGDAKYISADRKYSDSLIASAIDRVAKRYGVSPITVEQYKTGMAWRWATENGIDLARELSLYLTKLSRAVPAKKGV